MKIVISGTVGVGKSTISDVLVKELKKTKKQNINFYNELKDDNPYLDFYYKERSEWSFLIQLDFLTERFKTFINDAINNKNEISVFDRHFLDDCIFANLKSIKEDMSSFQWNIYFQLNKYLSQRIKENFKIDYLFLLKTDFDNVMKRIEKRGREYEKDENLLDYWKDLYFQYYENEEIQNYLKSSVKNFYIIDATKDSKVIVEEILKIIK